MQQFLLRVESNAILLSTRIANFDPSSISILLSAHRPSQPDRPGDDRCANPADLPTAVTRVAPPRRRGVDAGWWIRAAPFTLPTFPLPPPLLMLLPLLLLLPPHLLPPLLPTLLLPPTLDKMLGSFSELWL